MRTSLAIMTAAFAASLALSAPAEAGVAYKTLHAFCAAANCTDGSKAMSAPVADASGNYYGTTQTGGGANDGTVYQMTFDGARWHYKRIHSFCAKAGCADGSTPFGSLVVDTQGNLYGLTSSGGAKGFGAVFEMSMTGGVWKYRVIHSFCFKSGCVDGEFPKYSSLTYQGQASGVLYDGMSPLYGTTQYGGAQGVGAVFSLTPDATQTRWTALVLHSFCSKTLCADGSQPYSGVTVDAMGNLFGTTNIGGAYNHGALYELSFTGTNWAETVLYSFCAGGGFCADGDGPIAGLTSDGAGNYYGTTYFGGGHAKGEVFKLTPNGIRSTVTALYSFCAETNCADGENPWAGVTLDASGRIYGATYGGGANNEGIVFELAGTKLSTFFNLFSFGDTKHPGTYPFSAPVLDKSGALYGTTGLGGGNDFGTLYKLTP